MLITKVKRTYSKSINTKNYGLPESWIKVEATYEGKIESNDDPVHCSTLLHDAAKNDVISCVNELVAKMRGAATPAPAAPAPTAPVAPAPVAPAPVAPVIPYNENQETGVIDIAATPAELFPASDNGNGAANTAPAGLPPAYAAGVPTTTGYTPRAL